MSQIINWNESSLKQLCLKKPNCSVRSGMVGKMNEIVCSSRRWPGLGMKSGLQFWALHWRDQRDTGEENHGNYRRFRKRRKTRRTGRLWFRYGNRWLRRHTIPVCKFTSSSGKVKNIVCSPNPTAGSGIQGTEYRNAPASLVVRPLKHRCLNDASGHRVWEVTASPSLNAIWQISARSPLV